MWDWEAFQELRKLTVCIEIVTKRNSYESDHYLSILPGTVMSILQYRCTTWTLTKRVEQRLNANYTRILRAILNKSWGPHPTKQQLDGHIPPITKIIQVRRTRHARHCWRSKDKFIRDVLLWTPSHGRAKVRRPARTYIPQLCTDSGYYFKDLPGAMDDRDGWRERVWEMRAGSVTWWWWGWWLETKRFEIGKFLCYPISCFSLDFYNKNL